MKKELEDNLAYKYWSLFKYYKSKEPDGSYHGLYYGIETGDGWYDLISLMLAEIQNYLNEWHFASERVNINILQIKEKFGSLRVYIQNAPSDVHEIIRGYEEASFHICVNCGSGKEVTQNKEGFVRSLCAVCMKEFAQRKFSLVDGEL